MSSTENRSIPRLVTNLPAPEKEAVLQFTKQIIANQGDLIQSISLYGTGRKDRRGFEEVELLVVTHGEQDTIEDEVLDTVADVVVNTGVYLTVRCFSAEEYLSYNQLDLPLINAIRKSEVSLFQAR